MLYLQFYVANPQITQLNVNPNKYSIKIWEVNDQNQPADVW